MALISVNVEELRTKAGELDQQLQAQLDHQQFKMSHLGSIADAALQVSGVFEASQKAADMYMKSAVQQADEILAFANRQAASIVLQAEEHARHISLLQKTHEQQSGK